MISKDETLSPPPIGCVKRVEIVRLFYASCPFYEVMCLAESEKKVYSFDILLAYDISHYLGEFDIGLGIVLT